MTINAFLPSSAAKEHESELSVLYSKVLFYVFPWSSNLLVSILHNLQQENANNTCNSITNNTDRATCHLHSKPILHKKYHEYNYHKSRFLDDSIYKYFLQSAQRPSSMDKSSKCQYPLEHKLSWRKFFKHFLCQLVCEALVKQEMDC